MKIIKHFFTYIFARLTVLALIIMALLVASCATPKTAPDQKAILKQALPKTTNINEGWGKAISSADVSSGWLASFNDKKLESIVNEALSNNRRLSAAAANVDVAAGIAKQAGARLAPAVNVGGSGQNTARGDASSNLAGVSLNIQWEIDLWGKLGSAANAAELSFQATESDFEFARQSLVAQTAKAWFLATEANLQKTMAEEAVDIYQQVVNVVKTRVELGSSQQQDLYLAKADLASAQERLRQAQGAFEQSVRSIEVILGRYPKAELKVPSEFVPVPPNVAAGIPSHLLERRPDVIAAERQVAAAFNRIESAKAAKLPSISLTASTGRSSNALIDLLGIGKGFFSLGANFLAPIDLGGSLQAEVEIETAKQKAALANYGDIALNSFNEVEAALTNEVLLQDREGLLSASVENNNKALGIARTQYEFGQVNLLNVLQMQARTLNAKISLIRIKNARLAQRVDLHLALGGTFDE